MVIAAVVPVVHTTGINWESIGILFTGMGAVLIAGLTYITSRSDKREERTRGEIATAINSQTNILMAKLETKDAVNAIDKRLVAIEARMSE